MIGYIGAILAGVIVFFVITSVKLADKIAERTKAKAHEMLEEQKKKNVELLEKSKEHATYEKERLKKLNAELEAQLKRQTELVKEKEELSEKRGARLMQLEGTIHNLDKELTKKNKEVADTRRATTDAVAKKAGTTPETILSEIQTKFEHDFVEWKDTRLRETESSAFKEEMIPLAKDILRSTLQRYTDGSSVDRKEFSFELKRDDMKGPLVGAGGRNINYFEEKAECVVIFNYEPNLVIVSCLNMYKRAIAKEAMMSLSNEKRIDEKIIDTHLAKAKKKIDANIMEFGKKAAQKLGYKGLPEDLLYLVGRFEYRTSFGQNIWKHSMEVAFFARMLAEEIGANVQRALDAAFYHDLGKAIDHDLETSVGHDYLSKDLMEKFKMDPLTIHAAFAHHDAVPCIRPEDFLVKASDAMSASRPGARQQTIEKYIKLVTELQERASKFEGVKRVFTMNAGREVRVFVDERKVDDTYAAEMASKIAKDIEANMGYPGTIKINVVRITEAEDLAKEKIPMKRR